MLFMSKTRQKKHFMLTHVTGLDNITNTVCCLLNISSDYFHLLSYELNHQSVII